MANSVTELPDPRVFPDATRAPSGAARLYAVAQASLGAETGAASDAADFEVRAALAALLHGDGAALAALFTGSPSVAVTRHLWRQLDAVWRDAADQGAGGLSVTVFALPLVIVSGIERADAATTHPGVLDDPARLAAILREHRALAGNQTFALANALVGADAFDLPRLPEIFAWQRLPDSVSPGAALPERTLAPAPLAFPAGGEGVHLRFLAGSAVARPGADLLAEASVGTWGVPFTRELSRELGVAGSSVLALPRAPQRLLPAVAQGRAAQREVGAQIFASNAIRKLRAAVGEPVAVISAHRVPDAPGGGELRLSLSSPFAPRDAEGFRCPLHPLDRVSDVAAMLADLLADCRVTDVRVIGGVHPDRDPATGLLLLFKPDSAPGSSAAAVH